ncbi:MAG: T9SS type A sorting domain-containing protein [Saprospiraceae bacterium]|nr:T9SS type A sorting domain-containing protein [Saprospiraceae bacterium]
MMFQAKKHLILLILTLLIYPSLAQEVESEYERTLNFLQQQAEVDTNKIKALNRFQFYNSNWINVENSLAAYGSAVRSTRSTNHCSNDLAQFELIGPMVYNNTYNTPFNGLISAIIGDPNDTDFILIGTEQAGIWKWRSSTSRWENVSDHLDLPGLGIYDIIRNPCNSNHLVASTGINWPNVSVSYGLLESFDAGDTWSVNTAVNASIEPLNFYITHLKVNPYKSDCDAGEFFYYAVKEERGGTGCNSSSILEIKYDGTSTTSNITTPTCSPCDNSCFWRYKGIRHLEVSGRNSFVLSVGARYTLDGGLYTYDGSTTTWTNIPLSGFPSVQQFSLSNVENNIAYLAYVSGLDKHVHRLDLNTNSLSFVTTFRSIQFQSASELLYAPVNNMLYLGNGNFYPFAVLNLTTGQKQIFRDQGIHADVRKQYLASSHIGMDRILLATDGGVALAEISPNNLASSTITDQSGVLMPNNQFFNMAVGQTVEEKYLGGSMHQGIFQKGLSGNLNWRLIYGGDGVATLINPFNPNRFFYQSNSRLINDRGFLSTIINGNPSNWFTGQKLKADPNDADIVFWTRGRANSSTGHLSVYSYKTNGWVTHIPTAAMHNVGVVEVSKKDGAIFIANHEPGDGSKIKLERKDDLSNGSFQIWDQGLLNINGNVQTLRQHLSYKRINDVAVDPDNPNLIYLAISGIVTQGSNPHLAVPEVMRVLRSKDGGLSWEDLSVGLDATPCNKLLFQAGTDGRVFVSNEYGIFFRDNTFLDTDPWQCFHEQLPARVITGMEINYCRNELVVSAFGNGAWKTDLSVLGTVKKASEITTNTTWDNQSKVIYNDLVVKAGVKLMIQNCNIKLASDVKLIVEPTAQLTILGSAITALCEDNCWAGIAVEGNSNLPQLAANQGIVVINNSTISHARTALSAVGLTSDFSALDYTQMGGILNVINATFEDNRRAILINSYQHINAGIPTNNISTITNSSFLITDNYRDNCGSNEAFITMFAVDGVQIAGCSFQDQRNGIIAAADYRTGIKTFDASVRVIGNSSSGPNTFENLHRGIELQDISEDNPFVSHIEENVFRNNATAIRLENANNESELLRNRVFVGHPSGEDAYGLVLHNSSGFRVEENYCSRQQGTSSGFTRGFDILNTFNANNPASNPYFGHHIVYNNIAQDLSEGFTAWGDHLAANGDGLEFLCNQNLGNGTDFHFLNCLQAQQGSASQPAGNTFSCTSTSKAFVIGAAAAGCMTYFHLQGASCTNSFATAYPSMTFSAVNSMPSCSYIVSVEEKEMDRHGISIYPNPTSDRVTIKWPHQLELEEVRVFSLSGRALETYSLLGLASGYQLDLQQLPIGVYILQLKTTRGGISHHKLVKQQ